MINGNRPVRSDTIIALVVDDNEINRLVAAEVLRGCGVETVLAESGEQALELAAGCRFDLVFLDYRMPVMDGRETARRLRELGDWNRQVPIIGLSAEDNGVVIPGMNDSLGKPLDPARLETVLSRWMPHHKTVVDTERSSPAPMQQELEKLQRACPDLNVQATLQHIGGSGTAYIDVLKVFCTGIARNAAALLAHARDGDLENLRIAVHAQRGALYNIGAQELAKAAHRLELCITDGNYTKSLCDLPLFAQNLLELGERISALLDTPVDSVEKPVATQQQRRWAAESMSVIVALLKRLERDEALGLMRAVCALCYGGEADHLVEEALQGIENFDYDGASALLLRIGSAVGEV